jgi:hypothetical protein
MAALKGAHCVDEPLLVQPLHVLHDHQNILEAAVDHWLQQLRLWDLEAGVLHDDALAQVLHARSAQRVSAPLEGLLVVVRLDPLEHEPSQPERLAHCLQPLLDLALLPSWLGWLLRAQALPVVRLPVRASEVRDLQAEHISFQALPNGKLHAD